MTDGFQEQGQCFFIGLGCSIPTIVVVVVVLVVVVVGQTVGSISSKTQAYDCVRLSLLSVYRLLLWDWGLRTDRVYMTLSQPGTADLF